MPASRFNTFISILFLVYFLSLFPAGVARAEILGTELLNFETALEAELSTVTTLTDYLGVRGLSTPLNWNGSYSATGWNSFLGGTISGIPLSLSYTGMLSGDFGTQTVVVSYTATGSLGSDALFISGSSTWAYDASRQDYFDLDFAQLTKIGDPFWGWVVGLESVGGGLIGGAAGLAGGAIATAATGGLGLGAGIALTAGGALGGAGTAIGISVGVKELLKDDTPPPKPVVPQPRPVYPDTETPQYAQSGTIIIATNGLQDFAGSDLSGQYITSGRYSDTDNTFYGVTSNVPEPTSLILLSGSVLGYALSRIRRRRMRN